MFYALKKDSELRVRHKYFPAQGTVTGYFDNGKINVRWDNPRSMLLSDVAVQNLVFRVPARVRP